MQAPPQRERLAPEDREEARHRAELMRDRKRERERERRIDERGAGCQSLCRSFWMGAVLLSARGCRCQGLELAGQLRKL